MGMIPSKQVFVSSTTKDLWQYREEAAKVINEVSNDFKNRFQLVEVTMDTEALDGERIPAVERSKKWVDECDWIVLIVAWNYGYVPPDEKCSVTEWEYRQAKKSSKPCFVFLAGENSDGEKQYWPSKDREKENLANWKERGMVPEDHAEILKQFKEELRKTSVKIFSDLDDFLKHLEASLKKKIELELISGVKTTSKEEELKYDAQLLSVLIQLIKHIECCINEVKLLANLKQIHIRVHAIRQFGIRRWREEVSTQWSTGPLSGDAERTYLYGLVKVNEFRFKLEGYLQQIPDELNTQTNPLKDNIRKVLDTDFKEHPDNKVDFEIITNLYAGRVQTAFTGINTAMRDRANNMRYCQLFNSSIMGAKPILRSKDEDFLTQKIQALNTGQDTLKSVFSQHDEWQRMHDKLEKMDHAKGSQELFIDDLNIFIDNSKEMRSLLAKALRVAKHRGKLNSWKKNIEAVKSNLKALSNLEALSDDGTEASSERIHKALDTYEGMRKAFDDLFYDVDVVMLDEVIASEQSANQNFSDLQTMQNQVQARITTTTHQDT